MSKEQGIPFPTQDISDPIEAADEWLNYLHSGYATDKGKNAFSCWLATSPENVQAYKDAEQLWRDLGFACISAEQQVKPAETVELSAITTARPKTRVLGGWAVALAASITLVVSAAMLFFWQQPASVNQQYVSQTAELRTITLEDYSRVILSADSSLSVSFSAKARNLELLRGRAYFEVSPDPNRPFVVRSGNTKATAVGTAFDVNSHGEGVSVAVTHGIVDVKSYGDNTQAVYVNTTQITAGQRVLADQTGKISPAVAFDAVNELSWRSGRLVYQGEKLSVITAEINRYRTKKIRLLDKTLRDKRITLSVPADNTEQIIAAIEASEAVSVIDTPTEIRISKIKHD